MKSFRLTIRYIVSILLVVILVGLTFWLINGRRQLFSAATQNVSSPTPLPLPSSTPTAKPTATSTATQVSVSSVSTATSTATPTATPTVYYSKATIVLVATYTPTPDVTPTPTPVPAVQVLSDEPLLSGELLIQMGVGENYLIEAETWLPSGEIIVRVGYVPNATYWRIFKNRSQAQQADWQRSRTPAEVMEEMRQYDEWVDYVFVSPDGQWAAWGLGETLLVKHLGDEQPPVNLLGKIQYERVENGAGTIVWSLQSDSIAYVVHNGNLNRYEIRISDSLGEQTTVIPLKDTHPFHIAWSPNGQYLAFIMLEEPQSGINHLYLVRPDGSGLVQLTNHGSASSSVRWSPTGEAIVYTNGQPWIVTITPVSTEITEIKILDELQITGELSDTDESCTVDYYSYISWSPDNQVILASRPNGEFFSAGNVTLMSTDMWRFSLPERQWEMFIPNAGAGIWSPDGTKILYSIPEDLETRSIFVADSQGNNSEFVTRSRRGYPTYWLEDNSVLYYSTDTQHWSIYTLQNITASPAIQIFANTINSFSSDITEIQFAPAKNWIAYKQGTNLKISNQGNDEELLTDKLSGDQEIITWSPSGKKLAYVTASPEGYNYTIWIYNTEDGTNTRIVEKEKNIKRLSWFPDDQFLLFEAYEGGGVSAIQYINIDDSDSDFRTLLRAKPAAPQLSPDGKTLTLFKGCNLWLATLSYTD